MTRLNVQQENDYLFKEVIGHTPVVSVYDDILTKAECNDVQKSLVKAGH